MPTNVECICCYKIDAVVGKLQELPIGGTNTAALQIMKVLIACAWMFWFCKQHILITDRDNGDAEVEKSVHE